MCAVLGIAKDDILNPPPYIRILAMNKKGMDLMKSINKKTDLPVITKPASVRKYGNHARCLFNLESAATDLYVLAYSGEEQRVGGQEWRTSPVIAL